MDEDGPPGSRATSLMSASRTLGDLLDRDERLRRLLADHGPLPTRAGYKELARIARGEGPGELRLEKRRRMAEIAARDLAGELSLEDVGRALAELADACLEASLSATGNGTLAVIAMGKLGGEELNYSSDIDIMFVTSGSLREATSEASRLLGELGDVGPEGQAFRIDTDLRPEGRSGALVRSLDGYLEYYKRWAEPWEHQALIKARPAAGDPELGRAFMDQTRPLVFPPEIPPERIAEIRKMKARVEDHAQRVSRKMRARDADDVKLGPGGIRDIEFSVQLLQLVHGGSDDAVRSGNTLEALASLVDGGYVAEDDGAGLSVAYRWLRTIEHRLQLVAERQVHHLPSDPPARREIALTMGFKDQPEASATARFDAAHQGVLVDVRGRFEKLFYRPMIESLGDATATRLPPEALAERLRVLGFRDVDRAARTLTGLVVGGTRRARLFRVLTPALLRWVSESPSPDEGLFAFLRLGEALDDRPDILGALRDNPPGIRLLARVLGSGKLLGDMLVHLPEEVLAIAKTREGHESKDRGRLAREAVATLEWRSPDGRLDGLRRFKRREMLRVAVADIETTLPVNDVGSALSGLADACLAAGLTDPGFPFAVIGMGKLGGNELNYPSDIDVMFVHEGNPAAAEAVAEAVMRVIGEVTPEGQAFRIDADLRPEGRSGPLARSLASAQEYYEKWAAPWEHLALLKARFVAGDRDLGARFEALAQRHAYPEEVPAAALSEIRHLKARMERERIPRGVDARRHLKLGAGGMSDIEFAAQLIQHINGASRGSLRTTNTLRALESAASEGLLDVGDAAELASAYDWHARLRNRLYFLAGRPVDVLPVKPEELEAVGVSLGFSSQPRQELEETYLRITRRVRRIAEPVVFGDPS